jgi:copper chaperone CopZ
VTVALLAVRGMHCGGCEQRVQEALERVPGVSRAHAEHIGDEVELEYDAERVDAAALRAAVEAAGFACDGVPVPVGR